ncbi:MAG: hypothetical protein K9N06_00490 [Candidatus Cloacimonetes bacterium]|nr:hypothetical protein [Candidatus Cloacimonadota bacterium]
MRKIITLLVLISISGIWAAGKVERNNLGFVAGQLSRGGVGYRYWRADDWGYQISGMLLATKDDIPDYYDNKVGSDYYGWGRQLTANTSISVMKTLKKNNTNRFYMLVGYGFYHQEKKRWVGNDYNMSGAEYDGYKVTNRHYWGTGVGVDFEIMEYFRGFLEIPITFQSDGEITMYIPQIGIFYKF